MLSRQVAAKLATYETPFYLYDVDLLHQTLDSLMSVASRYNYKVHYAIKANYDPRLLQIIREHGLGIDCARASSMQALESEIRRFATLSSRASLLSTASLSRSCML